MPARVLLAALAGVGLSLAFEPVAFFWVMPLALGAFALLTRGVGARSGLAVGLVFGAAFYFTTIWWMNGSIGVEGWVTLSTTETLFYGVLGAVATRLHRLRAWPFWLACAWVSVEVLRSTWPLSGMPFGRLPFAVVDTPVAPALAYVGMNGVSFLLAATGFLLARVALSRRPLEGLVALGSLVAVGALSLVPSLAPYTLPTTGQARVAAVQGNVPGPGNNVLYDPFQLTVNHAQATVELARRVAAGETPAPDFVVWPENSTASDPFRDPALEAEIDRAVAAVDVPVLVGALVYRGDGELLNQGIVWDPVTGPGERYGKQNPVPYGEYIPWRDQMPSWFLTAGRLGEITRDSQAGTRTTPLRIAGVSVADAICFDVAYDAGLYAQVEDGAQMLVVQTSNASFIFTDQVEQQFAITRLRAVETGRWLVVASTNGLSGIIAPDGSVVQTAPALAEAVLTDQVGLVEGVTPGVRLGAWPVRAFTVLMLLGLVLSWRAAPLRRRDRRSEPDDGPAGTMETSDPPGEHPAPAGSTREVGMSSSRSGGPRTVVVVPTYDEIDNLAWILERMRHAQPDLDVLVVDDDSPDGTGRLADDLAAADDRLHVLHRTTKSGLGAAYLAGFAWALERGYDVIGEMDADGSHAPEQLGRLREAILDADLVIGSRYVAGGAVHNWPWHRQALSRGGNAYVRVLLGLPVRDATAGFRLFRREALEVIDLGAVRSVGYVFQTDLTARAIEAGLRVREVPIDFVERTRGESKMNGAIAVESLRLITRWGLAQRRERWSGGPDGAGAAHPADRRRSEVGR